LRWILDLKLHESHNFYGTEYAVDVSESGQLFGRGEQQVPMTLEYGSDEFLNRGFCGNTTAYFCLERSYIDAGIVLAYIICPI
jgi:hypothetical protein